MPPSTLSRLDRRIAELGDTTPTTVLCVCGDVMRSRPTPESARPEETERALSALSVGDVTQAIRTVDLVLTQTALRRAADDAFEAAFADSTEERELFVASTMEGLARRDRVASLLVAARARVELARSGGADAEDLERACADLETRLGALERSRASLARKLTGANAARRTALAALTQQAATAAWWYAERASDDGLLPALGGEPGEITASIQADLSRSALPVSEAAALDSAGLLAASQARLDGAARARLTRRSASDADLRAALDLASDLQIERDAESA